MSESVFPILECMDDSPNKRFKVHQDVPKSSPEDTLSKKMQAVNNSSNN